MQQKAEECKAILKYKTKTSCMSKNSSKAVKSHMRINWQCFFGPNLPKNRFWGQNFENQFWTQNFKNVSLDLKSAPPRYHVRQFSGKTDSFDFCSKTDLVLEIEKTNVGIRISILEIPCMPIFWQNRQL